MSKYTYSNVPKVYMPRSSHDLSYGHKTSMQVGEIVPIYCDFVYPGTTYKTKASLVARSLNSFIKPVMDNAFVDVMFFSVPCRVLDDKFETMFGKGDPDDWSADSKGDYELPKYTFSEALTADDTKNFVGSLPNYFGDVPAGVAVPAGLSVSQLPYRAYAKIYNDWFRDENFEYPVDYKGSTLDGGVTVAKKPSAFGVDNIFNAYPAKANKFHDRFTSSLPAPQKGSAVSLPLSGNAPVVMSQNQVDMSLRSARFGSGANWSVSLIGDNQVPVNTLGTVDQAVRFMAPATSSEVSGNTIFEQVTNRNNAGVLVSSDGTYISSLSGSNLVADVGKLSVDGLGKGLTADMSSVTASTVNDLRFAFQLQKQLQRLARGGTRYTEYIQSAFGVTSPDARLQRSEYLGGKRIPLNVQQVAQTSASTENNPLGDVGAFSLSAGQCGYVKSFTEHSIILGVAMIRYFHTYSQGIPAWHRRLRRIDMYDPVFANIGEQPVYSTELYAGANKDRIFGYQEAWADLRKKSNVITGALQPGSGADLDYWTFADNYANTPTLNSQFIKEDPENLDRCLAFTTSATTPPFIVDIWFDQVGYLPLPVYSVPGLIDHH